MTREAKAATAAVIVFVVLIASSFVLTGVTSGARPTLCFGYTPLTHHSIGPARCPPPTSH